MSVFLVSILGFCSRRRDRPRTYVLHPSLRVPSFFFSDSGPSQAADARDCCCCEISEFRSLRAYLADVAWPGLSSGSIYTLRLSGALRTILTSVDSRGFSGSALSNLHHLSSVCSPNWIPYLFIIHRHHRCIRAVALPCGNSPDSAVVSIPVISWPFIRIT